MSIINHRTRTIQHGGTLADANSESEVLLAGAIPPNDASSFQRGDQVELGRCMIARLLNENRTLIVGDEGELFGYSPPCGLWVPVGGDEQSKIVQSFAGATVKNRKDPLRISAFDVRGARTLAYDKVAKPGYFSAAPAGFAFTNGFVGVTDACATLSMHSPDHRARVGFPFDYVRNSPAPLFFRLLDDLFRGDADKNEKIAALQEHAGACLIGIATTYQTCVVCIGSGDDGKSTLAKIISECFPLGTVEAVPPQEFDQGYRRALLAGKLLNVVSGLAEVDIGSEKFKALVAGALTAGRRIRQAPFSYKPRAGHLLLANRLLGASDPPHGLRRHFIVIRFNHHSDDPPRDPKMADKILAMERQGIVAWMLEGAVRLMVQNGYTIPASHHVTLADGRLDSDPIAAFVEEFTLPALDGRGTLARALHDSYRTWAQEKGHPSVSATKFGIRLRQLGRVAKKTRVGMIYPVLVRAPPNAVRSPEPGSATVKCSD